MKHQRVESAIEDDPEVQGLIVSYRKLEFEADGTTTIRS